MEVLWTHTYSSYNGQMVRYCVREAGSGIICLPQMEKEMVGGRTSQFLSHVTRGFKNMRLFLQEKED